MLILLFLLSWTVYPSFTSPVTLDSVSLGDLNRPDKVPKPLNLYGHETTMEELFSRAIHNTDLFSVDRKKLLLLSYDYGDLNIPTAYRGPLDSVVDLDQSRADLKTQTDGIDYIDRNYNRDNQRFAEIPGRDTPTTIAENLLYTDKKFAVVLGEPGSGKTVALTKILSLLRTDSPITWSLMVDLQKAVPHPVRSDWTPSRIFSETLGPKQNEIFQELLKNSPEKVNIILDNLNAVPGDETKRQIYRYVRGYNTRGAGLVISMTPNIGQSISIPTKEEIRRIQGPPKHSYVEIPSLTPDEISTFLKRQLEVQLEPRTFKPEYAEVISKIISETPIPKNFEHIKQLNDLILSGDRLIFVDDEFEGLREYLKTKRTSPQEFSKILKSVELNKLKLYERFTERLVPSEEAATYFGLQALDRIMYPSDSSAERTLATTRKADLHYTGNGEDFPLLRHNQRESIFIHAEYDQFFAAKILIYKPESSGITLIQKTRILTDSRYAGLVEFINAGIAAEGSRNFDAVLQEILQNHGDLRKTLNFAVSHKFDALAAVLFEKMTPQALRQYLRLDSGQKVSPRPSSFGYNLGMMKGNDPSLKFRQQMLFKNVMEQSINTINMKQQQMAAGEVTLWRSEDFGQYIDDFVLPDVKLSGRKMRMILDSTPKTMIREAFLNDQLLKIVKHGGRGILHIVKDLVRRGATPSTINNDGTTIIHAALENLDLSQLMYFIDDLNVPIIDSPQAKSLLIPILDANPLPYVSPMEFWEVTEYIEEKSGGLKVPEANSPELSTRNVFATTSDKLSPIYKLLVGSLSEAEITQARSALENSPELLNKLSSPVKQYRRNYILTNDRRRDSVVTEILIKYRGLDSLSDTEEAAYKRCLTSALKRDAERMTNGRLSEEQVSRIHKNLLDNIGTKADYQYAKQFIESDLSNAGVSVDRITKLLAKADSKFADKMAIEARRPSKLTLENGVALTRAQVYPRIVAGALVDDEFSSRRTLKSRIGGSILCGGIRRRRRDTSPCFVSEEEYREIVGERVKNGKILRTVNTKKFHELTSQAEETGQMEKYRELISIGRKLREAGATLEENYQSRFRVLTSADESRINSQASANRITIDSEPNVPWRNKINQGFSEIVTNAQVHSPRMQEGIPATYPRYGSTYDSGVSSLHISNHNVLYPSANSRIPGSNVDITTKYEPTKTVTLESTRYKPNSLPHSVTIPKVILPKIPGGRNGRK